MPKLKEYIKKFIMLKFSGNYKIFDNDEIIVDNNFIGVVTVEKNKDHFVVKEYALTKNGCRAYSIISVKNGVKDGKEIRYWINGKKCFVRHYANGKMHGTSTGWDSNGNLVYCENYNNGAIGPHVVM